ncbi:MAG: DUF1501 domain-containing protein, partial [Burkholderiales bacterium]|nr:DUF1501 domain-containing protein [Burkholderiales bacterium]
GSSNYRALVCVFLYGGNDGNNMLIPTDSSTYAAYAGVRGSLALPNQGLATLGAAAHQGGMNFALHPALSAIAPLYQQGAMAAVANVGTLIHPMTAASYRAKSVQTPYSLFSHSDQQHQWQSSQSSQPALTGWGGRVADRLAGLNGQVTLPAVTSVAQSNVFGNGQSSSPLVVPSSGSFGLKDTSGSAAAARNAAIANLLGLDVSNNLVSASSTLLSNAIAASNLVNPILQNTSPTIATSFSGLNTNIAQQLMTVAKLIEARATTGLSRQIFFVSLNGFDTHSNQLNVQQSLFSQLGAALAAFYNATVALGVDSQVTTFTASDFARTLRPNSTGTDHAWGNHHLVIGSAVKGGDVYGTFPTLALNGPDDADGSGRWVPTTSVDQYAATLASWLGVSSSDLAIALPNLSSFASTNIGFV